MVSARVRQPIKYRPALDLGRSLWLVSTGGRVFRVCCLGTCRLTVDSRCNGIVLFVNVGCLLELDVVVLHIRAIVEASAVGRLIGARIRQPVEYGAALDLGGGFGLFRHVLFRVMVRHELSFLIGDTKNL
eukprot:XP_001705539.1 Hypothetical protein GL50803_32028 [Giardia lamblia ATCC 50803]